VQIIAPNGRTLGYELLGPHDGDRVVSIHGTPGSRIGRFPIGDPYTAAGVRVLKFDRAGYGLSTRLPGRSVGDCAADVAAITHRLGWETFAVTGASGGGPHALACGALLRERVSRVMVEASLAPFDARGFDWYAEMANGNVEEFRAAERGEQAVRAVVEREAEGILKRLDGDPAELLGASYELADADLTAMSNAAVVRELRATLREALRPGLDGWVDDDLAFVNPWGFDPQTITRAGHGPLRRGRHPRTGGARPLARHPHPRGDRGAGHDRPPRIHGPRPDRSAVPLAGRALRRQRG
jgi:pimeloyl-ACP methyl ester carboxylesterase